MSKNQLLDLIKNSAVLAERGFVFDASKARAQRVVRDVRQRVYLVKGRHAFRDVSLTVSLSSYESATDLHLEQIETRLVILYKELRPKSSYGIGPVVLNSTDSQERFDSLLQGAFDIFFDKLETMDEICEAAHGNWRRLEPFGWWSFKRSILEECGVIPRLSNSTQEGK